MEPRTRDATHLLVCGIHFCTKNVCAFGGTTLLCGRKKLNSQSLEDTQVGYTLQKYTLEKYSLEKCTLKKYSLGKILLSRFALDKCHAKTNQHIKAFAVQHNTILKISAFAFLAIMSALQKCSLLSILMQHSKHLIVGPKVLQIDHQ